MIARCGGGDGLVCWANEGLEISEVLQVARSIFEFWRRVWAPVEVAANG